MAARAARLNRARLLNRSAVKKQLFGERRLPGIRVRNNRKIPATVNGCLNFGLQFSHYYFDMSRAHKFRLKKFNSFIIAQMRECDTERQLIRRLLKKRFYAPSHLSFVAERLFRENEFQILFGELDGNQPSFVFSGFGDEQFCVFSFLVRRLNFAC